MGGMPKLLLFLGSLLLATALAAQVNEPALKVTVRSLRFDDTVGLSPAIRSAVTRHVTNQSYDADYETKVPEVVRDGLQRFGYFNATVESLRFKTVRRTSTSLIVDIAAVVNQDARYRLRSIEIKGATAFSTLDLRRQFPIRDGDVFNIELARRGIKRLKDLYCTKGYINFTPIPDFTMDARERRISMRLDIDEGHPYRVGKLTVAGEESVSGAKQRLRNAWTKYEGSTYRCDVMQQVLRDVHARPSLPLHEMLEVEHDNTNHVLNYKVTLGRPHRVGFLPKLPQRLKPQH
jgi:outer membrane protein assembly factor BamA